MAELRAQAVVPGDQLDPQASAFDNFCQYADGGLMGSKPYVATDRYIQRMSPHCKGCRYDPAQRSGSTACPYTALYWDFLMRHEAMLACNPRMALQAKNVARLSDADKQAVQARAAAIRRGDVGQTPA